MTDSTSTDADSASAGNAGDYRTSALGKDRPGERRRLGAIQSSVDEFSTDIFDGLGPRVDWDCLDLGAGAGSIAAWLAERCPAGRTVAVDIDTRYLDPAESAFEVAEADITDPGFAPGRFDLVHARFVLCHLPDRDAVLARAATWLKPGGWLVVTDPYQLPADTSPFPVMTRIMDAYRKVYAGHGADLTWSRRLPTLLAGAGLSSIEFTGKLACMGNLARDRWRPLIDQVATGLIATGEVTQTDLDEFHTLLADPTFIDIPQFTLAAWGRREDAADTPDQ
ncbi:class I SAM-dependent methyltransferase [Actinokineospora iranica]|uniref:Methyltransferase domain-containing protein n=1 Tax=Actinokineospora iranica TaxID=1271860 RepID=A0A1G6Z5C1_9PSEU|nr:class I SAM-dependent methyltransferase [Actinokineospora iranica]SDD97026.1 Methyltransferase domain-containing protein [Actinokineospora iranica]